MSARAQVLGCSIDRVDMNETLGMVEDIIANGEFTQHMAINAAKLVTMHDDPKLTQIVDGCGLVNADGQAVVWASRMLGDPLPERVAGIDLMHELLALAERKGYRVFFLGARAEVLQTAVEKIHALHPELAIAGARDGYFGADEEPALCEEIRASRPDILFVAMSSPRKEYFLGEHGRSFGAPFVMGVGGSIDVIAGITRRAPRFMQKLGLEWLFRLLQEPQRMFRRYAVTNWRFAVLVARARMTGQTTLRREAHGEAL
jgi:N-acetylglucosaminyldiphosphoundecaprenol N-acetyl-beta-D-mannosaminyltransferase